MAHNHAKLIEQLGGYKRLAERLAVSPSLVWNWQERGISYAWRPQVASVAKKSRVAVPADFLMPPKSRAA